MLSTFVSVFLSAVLVTASFFMLWMESATLRSRTNANPVYDRILSSTWTVEHLPECGTGRVVWTGLMKRGPSGGVEQMVFFPESDSYSDWSVLNVPENCADALKISFPGFEHFSATSTWISVGGLSLWKTAVHPDGSYGR